MNDHSIPLSIATDLLEQSDSRALRGMDQAELNRLRSALKKTLTAVDTRLAEAEIDEILGLIPDIAAHPARWNN